MKLEGPWQAILTALREQFESKLISYLQPAV
jgi:hypothetical protein